MHFDKNSIQIDAPAEADRLARWLSQTVRGTLHRRGAVVGISGGVDSAVVLALCVCAFKPQHVLALMLPERDSSPESERLARELADQFGVEVVKEDITAALDGFGCYDRRDEAIRRVIPQYDPAAGDRAKLVLPSDLLQGGALNVFSIVVVRPDGSEESRPLPTAEFLQVVAASNFKQRSRMAMLYYHGELRHYAVVGTANRNEHAQGFFVKHGDGGVDLQPIGHLYKTQVYQLARHLEIPAEIVQRTPTTDTYSAPSNQQEFFFRVPFETMDLSWYALEHDIPISEVAAVMELEETQVQRVFDDLKSKRRATEYLRCPPLEPAPIPAGVPPAQLQPSFV
jgi:NAD+ synthase